MKIARKLTIAALGTTLAPAAAVAQVPDLVNAFDAGGRAMGMGGATYVTGSDTLSSFYNPAGLAYLTRPQLGLVFRNLPESNTTVTGDLVTNPRFDTQGSSGATSMSHAGIAFPLAGRNGSTNGTIALSLTTGGFVRDERVAGPGLTEGGLPVPGYTETLKLRTDFVNLSYGRSTGDGSFNWGFGLIYAQNKQIYEVARLSGFTNVDEIASGFGFQAGLQFVPRNNPNISFGLSYRSPINLTSRGSQLVYDRIPGRLAAGAAVRRDGLRSGRDFVLLGAEIQHFFEGNRGGFVDRDRQTMLGVGFEYNYSMGAGRIPIRLGYNFVPAGGANFISRDALTYGIGYRPVNGDFAVDLNFARAQHGGSDISLGISYRFGR